MCLLVKYPHGLTVGDLQHGGMRKSAWITERGTALSWKRTKEITYDHFQPYMFCFICLGFNGE